MPPRRPSPRLRAPVFVGIVDFPGAQAAAILGLTDLFAVADGLHRARGRADGLDVVTLRAEVDGPRPLAALIVPPILDVEALHPRPELAELVAARHREGTVACSVCVGAFVLAEAGLLDGRPATTHWAVAERFRARFPAVRLDPDRLVVDDGDVVTAGGLMAWVDLGLRLVARYLGPTTTLEVARHLLVDPGGREQRFYATFAPPTTHGDAAILAVQRWLQGQVGGRVDVPSMARQARLSERTFQRRFARATGLTPTGYLQHLRVARARELLETGTESVEAVAAEVGYADASAFRRVFVELVGLTPGEYRRRFTP